MLEIQYNRNEEYKTIVTQTSIIESITNNTITSTSTTNATTTNDESSSSSSSSSRKRNDSDSDNSSSNVSRGRRRSDYSYYQKRSPYYAVVAAINFAVFFIYGNYYCLLYLIL
jgi:hypothetical protein